MCMYFSSKYPTDHLLYHFENVNFEWKLFVHVSLNANEMLLPTPFSRTGLCLYSSYLKYFAKKHLIDFDYHVYHAENMCFKAI